MRRFLWIVLFVPLLTFAATDSIAQQPSHGSDELVIATKSAPPFAMKNADGSWSGISIELWKRVAQQLGLKYRFDETTLDGMLVGLASGRYDAGVAALTVTADRERTMDFTHPFYATGLGIATVQKQAGIVAYASQILSYKFLKAILALLVVLTVVGTVIWLLERRGNRDQFGGGATKGIGNGIWWSAVTMTTVGYGDKAPATLAGRVVGMIWMFASVITISGFTAAIASAITVGNLQTSVRSPDDLSHVRVGTVVHSASTDYLKEQHIESRGFNSLGGAIDALDKGRLDAVVYDKPLLRYQINKRKDEKLTVLPYTLLRQDYAIGLPRDSELRKAVNRALLEETHSQAWRDLIALYLGKD